MERFYLSDSKIALHYQFTENRCQEFSKELEKKLNDFVNDNSKYVYNKLCRPVHHYITCEGNDSIRSSVFRAKLVLFLSR